MIFANSLRGFKAFLGKSADGCADFSHVTAFVACFLLPVVARRSVLAVARAIRSEFRDAGNLLRFLGGSSSPAVLLAAAQQRLLDDAHQRDKRLHLLLIDSTQHDTRASTVRTLTPAATPRAARPGPRASRRRPTRRPATPSSSPCCCAPAARASPTGCPSTPKNTANSAAGSTRPRPTSPPNSLLIFLLRTAYRSWSWATPPSRPSRSARPAPSGIITGSCPSTPSACLAGPQAATPEGAVAGRTPEGIRLPQDVIQAGPGRTGGDGVRELGPGPVEQTPESVLGPQTDSGRPLRGRGGAAVLESRRNPRRRQRESWCRRC